jgi:hypothetical protein
MKWEQEACQWRKAEDEGWFLDMRQSPVGADLSAKTMVQALDV